MEIKENGQLCVLKASSMRDNRQKDIQITEKHVAFLEGEHVRKVTAIMHTNDLVF